MDEKQYEIPYGGKPAKDGGSAKSMSYAQQNEQLNQSAKQINKAGVAPPESFVGTIDTPLHTPSQTRPIRHTHVWWVVMCVVVLVLGGLALWRLCVV